MRFAAGLCFALCLFSTLHAHAVTSEEFRYDFANGSRGWSVDFADYPAGQEEFYELASGFRRLPGYVAKDRFALRIQGNNHSDDLCMFLRRQISGLKPNTRYVVTFGLTLASNAATGSVGIGGSPGDSVYVKVGVTLVRPAADPVTRLLNIDKGEQSQGGADAIVLGNVGVEQPDDGSHLFRVKRLQNEDAPFIFTTDEQGNGWLFVATDSGYEGTTRLYVLDISARFIQQ